MDIQEGTKACFQENRHFLSTTTVFFATMTVLVTTTTVFIAATTAFIQDELSTLEQ